MKVKFFAAYRRSGISKTSGRPYDFAEVAYVVPLRQVETEKFQQFGHGFDVKTLTLANQCIAEFAGIDVGEEVELKVNPNPEDPSRNMCFGLLS